MRKFYLAIVVTLVVTTFLGAGVGQAGPSAQGQLPPIRLKAATFTPGRGELPAIPRGLTIAGYTANQRGYYIVQFRGPIEVAWKGQLSELGVELLDYVPDLAFKVRMTSAQARQVEQLGDVAWVGLFHPAYKLNPNLIRNGTHAYTVRIEKGASLGQTQAALAATGAQVLGLSDGRLVVAANSAQLDAIAQVLDVAWVENYILPEKHNEYGGGVIMGSATANASGYDGSTQINLAWVDNASNEDGLEIERCQGQTCTNFAWIANVPANTTNFSNTGLKGKTYYRYRVRVYNSGGYSSYSNIATARTN